MRSLFILFLAIYNIDGQEILNTKDYAMLEQEVLQNIRRPILELINAFLDKTNKQFDQVENLCSKNTQNQKEMFEMILALNNTLATRTLREDEKDMNSNLTKEYREQLTAQAAEIDDLRRELVSLKQQLTKSCPDFHMDETTLRSGQYLSEDKKTLLNNRCPADEQQGEPRTTCSFDWPAGSYNEYYGTRGSLLINAPNQVYYEVTVTYTITADLQGRWMIFEVGLARDDVIDLSYCVVKNQYGWSVFGARDDTTGKVNINFANNGEALLSETLSESTLGTSKTMTLGIYVNTQNNQMSVVDVDKDVLMYTFINVDFTQPLRPVFAVFIYGHGVVTLQLKTGTCLKGLPISLRQVINKL